MKAEFDKLNEIGMQYLEEAKELGEKFDKNIEHTLEYVQFERDLFYLHNMGLLDNSQAYIDRLKKQISEANEMLRDAIRYKNMSELEKQAFDKLKDMNNFKTAKDTVQLARVLYEITLLIQEMGNKMNEEGVNMDQTADMNNQQTGLKRLVEDLVTDLCKQDLQTLLDLSYELLKIEADVDPFVHDLLQGQVKPNALVDIICSNYYNKKTNKVEPKEKQQFRLVIGPDNHLLQYKSDSGSKHPISIASNLEKGHVDIFKLCLTKKNGFIVQAGNQMLCTEQYGTDHGEVD